MKIAIIGSGNVGKALATSAKRGGHSVSISASSPENAQQAAQTTGVEAANSNSQAVAGAEVVILAVPAGSISGVVADLGSALDGKAVVDVSNRVNPSDPGSVLDGSSMTEKLQGQAKGARFVKAFNTVFASVMANPEANGMPADIFIAGDDAAAKSAVAELAGSMGFRPLDVGSLAIARVLEGMALVNITLQVSNGWPWQSAWKLIGPTGKAS
jgi:8-hydroxy-5-deazaflavin:NADPH oxidoreductase